MKDRILQLLINGLSSSEVASVVGCSQSYVVQLLKDEDFKEKVKQGMLAAQAERTEEEHIDTRYQTLEHKILNSISDGLDEASLGEKVRALETIHKRQETKHRLKNPVAQNPALQVNVISLQLPNHAVARVSPVIQMNTQAEIVAIDNQPLAPMSSTGVKNLFAQITAAKAQAVPVTVDQAIAEM